MKGRKKLTRYKVPKDFQKILTDLIIEILIQNPKDIIDFCADYFQKMEKGKPKIFVTNSSIDTMATTYSIPNKPKESEQKNQSNHLGSNKRKLETQKSTRGGVIPGINTGSKDPFLGMKDNKGNNLLFPGIQINKGNKKKEDEEKTKQEKKEKMKLLVFDCIDFTEKEQILNSIKDENDFPDLTNDYITHDFIPNKKYNSLISLSQKCIMLFYSTKGKENDEEFSKMCNEINNEVKLDNNKLLMMDFSKMQIQEAINIFRQYGYYLRVLKCYLYKLELLSKNIYNSDKLIEEMCFFIFVPSLKEILANKIPKGKVDKNKNMSSLLTYISNYFNINLKMLVPDLYTYALRCKFYDEDEMINNFINFELRKRELAEKFLSFYCYNIENKSIYRKLDSIRKCLYFSTPQQILKSISNVEIRIKDFKKVEKEYNNLENEFNRMEAIYNKVEEELKEIEKEAMKKHEEKMKKEKEKNKLYEEKRKIENEKNRKEEIKTKKEEEIEDMLEKIEEKFKDYPVVRIFISKIINTPVSLIGNNINEFMHINTLDREIIINYLSLREDYHDIRDKLVEVHIDNIESNFALGMEEIYFNILHLPELNFIYLCLFRNNIYEIPKEVQKFFRVFDNFNNTRINEDQILEEFKKKNVLLQTGIYLYLSIKLKEKTFLGGLVRKLRLEKEKIDSLSKRLHIDSLRKNFTGDSDEVVFFIKQYKEWKKEISKDVLEYFEKKSDEEKDNYFKSLPDEPHKKIIYNLLSIEDSFDDSNKNIKPILEKLKKIYPEIDELQKS